MKRTAAHLQRRVRHLPQRKPTVRKALTMLFFSRPATKITRKPNSNHSAKEGRPVTGSSARPVLGVEFLNGN
jgi:hypothetical protein